MKLTKTQWAYLRSAAASPIGKTVIYAGSALDALTKHGLVKQTGYGVVVITDAGRAALEERGDG